MPKLLDKKKVLGGRAEVISYERDPGTFFLRKFIDGSYRTEKLEDAKTLDQAEQAAFEVFLRWEKQGSSVVPVTAGIDVLSVTSKGSGGGSHHHDPVPGRKRRNLSPSVKSAVQEFLIHEKERVDSGRLEQSTYDRKRGALLNHLLPYLAKKGVSRCNQFQVGTFKEYEIYRKGARNFTVWTEVSKIADWINNWCIPRKYLPPEVIGQKKFIPEIKISGDDLLANPAINPDDWKVIVDHTRDKWRKTVASHPNHRAYYWRTMFWHFILLMKNSGARPEELLKLRWKDVEIRDYKRENSKGEEVERLICFIRVQSAKTKQWREIPCNQGNELRRWRNFIDEYMKNNPKMRRQITYDTKVFGYPAKDMETHKYGQYQKAWEMIRAAVEGKLRGHKFSPMPYTIYSMRSTFIEDHLYKRTDLFLLSRVTGHSPQMLLKHYEKIDVRSRAEELTAIEFGKKKEIEPELIDLIGDDPEEAEG